MQNDTVYAHIKTFAYKEIIATPTESLVPSFSFLSMTVM